MILDRKYNASASSEHSHFVRLVMNPLAVQFVNEEIRSANVNDPERVSAP